ncbi:DUF3734 domain-containing protein [Rhizobium halophytocola]|uniref:NTE family protein n=1 Tax=Rhizobium halophytocola TaxID=735519 RepID=A0ABS4DXU3_9HYPH|nr:patatin-like phospholipase family protein [Rhizobium halophytocola]MBP1850509.1 NTE family protein [Rhizobium halophytocola]
MSERLTTNVIVFQGGGALGAYQAGAYEALHKTGIEPDWLAGISIGAINSAIIAGTPRERRVEHLRRFWDRASSGFDAGWAPEDPAFRRLFNEVSAMTSAMTGVPGFFSPRLYTPYQLLLNPESLISFYDTQPLIDTLETLVDFDFLQQSDIRLSLGAVNVTSGNFAYFDNRKECLNARHVAASGALPPGFAPIEIDGAHYWDGGLVSNTPLQYVLNKSGSDQDLCIFQVDLFSARGQIPRDQFEVEARTKEIRFSSRTRMNTDEFARKQILRRAAKRLLEKLPPEMRDDEDARILASAGVEYDVTIVHLIHRKAANLFHGMDAEFSRATIEDHWRAGYDDVMTTLEHKAWKTRKRPKKGIQIFDLAGKHARVTEDAAFSERM